MARARSSRLLASRAVVRRLHQMADPRRAAGLQRFFRTGPGEYGAGDRFLGLYVPQIREVAREYPSLALHEVEGLLESPWHETRLLGVMLLTQAYNHGDPRDKEQIYRLYLRRTDRINNWDLVDLSAPTVVGAHLLRRSRAPLFKLARSKSVWERRIAIVATQHFIKHGLFADTLRLAKLLIRDQQDLIHKAVGWMLREVGKRDRSVLIRFLDGHAARLPRTTLRYAIERLTPAERKRYMSAPRQSRRR